MVIYYAARPLDAKRLVLLAAMSAAMFVAVVFLSLIHLSAGPVLRQPADHGTGQPARQLPTV